jgi:HD-GYP domain-containing protein (c-di-GMP phosphodiesterase class II)
MARIIAVADTFDAMTTHRPYQTAMTTDAALRRLNELKGVVLDERLVDAFSRAYRSGEFGAVESTVTAPEPVPA